MNITLDGHRALECAIFGWVHVVGGKVTTSSPSLRAKLDELVRVRSMEDFPPEPIKNAVRSMLRGGGFKPTGRQKPASEYLAQSAREGSFPYINGPVDCNNYLSLRTGYPISLLDADVTGEMVQMRIALSGETYVFNAGGQEMDLEGLLCVCGKDGTPLGNPVKDSMKAKLKADTTSFAGFIYAPRTLVSLSSMEALASEFAALLVAETGGTIVSSGACDTNRGSR